MNLKFLRNQVFRQTTILSGANFFSLSIGFLVALLLPKVMGKEEYGLFSLACAVVSFCAIFFEFGFFVSAARLLVITSDAKKKHEVVAMSLWLFIFLGILFAALMYGVSFFIDNILRDAVGYIISSAAIVSVSFFSAFVAQQLFQGLNAIDRLSIYTFFSKLIYFALLAIAWLLDLLSAKTVFWAFSIAPLIAFCMVFFSYWRIQLTYREELLQNILCIYKEFGMKNYFARIVDTAAKQINGILLGIFCGAVDVGLFTLCTAVASPANVISQSLTAAKFRDFGGYRIISNKLIAGHYTTSVMSSLFCFALAYLLFHYYYLSEYPQGMSVFIFCMIGMMFQSIYTLYNGWLAVNGCGNAMLHMSCVNAVVCFGGYGLLIPVYGIYGAAITVVTSNLYFMLHTLYYYHKYSRGSEE